MLKPYADTVLSLLQRASKKLADAGIDQSRFEADILLAHTLNWSRHQLLLEPDHQVDAGNVRTFLALVERRCQFEPVAYLTGQQEFYGLDFEVSPATLIPRPDTETLVETALKFARGRDVAGSLLDLGTGTGCLPIALLHMLPDWSGMAVDTSVQALDVAGRNAHKHGLDDRLDFVKSNWFGALSPDLKVDLIISNPPYITVGEMTALMPDVRDYEPHSALEAGVDGLACYRTIIAGAGSFLKSAGMLAVEIGKGQQDAVTAMFHAAGLTSVRYGRDLSGIIRVVSGIKCTAST